MRYYFVSVPDSLLSRRRFLQAIPFLVGLTAVKGHGANPSITSEPEFSNNSIDSKKQTKQEKNPAKEINRTPTEPQTPLANRMMHKINPTLSSSLPAIAAEFYEAKALITNNFVKHENDEHSTEDALRYDNADAFSRPWAALSVHLGALVSRIPANYLAARVTKLPELQSRFSSMVGYYTIVAECKYLRNPVLGILRDAVKAELDTKPKLYKNDPRNIPLIAILKSLRKKRDELEQSQNLNPDPSVRDLNTQRAALDLVLFSLSFGLGLKFNASLGKTFGGIVGSASILRDIVSREEAKNTNPDDLLKLGHRTRAEMVTWPSLFTFNAGLQVMIKTFIPKLFPEDTLAQEHLVEMIGNLSQAGVYCVGKAPAQAKLEMMSELGQFKKLWKAIDWYVKP